MYDILCRFLRRVLNSDIILWERVCGRQSFSISVDEEMMMEISSTTGSVRGLSTLIPGYYIRTSVDSVLDMCGMSGDRVLLGLFSVSGMCCIHGYALDDEIEYEIEYL